MNNPSEAKRFDVVCLGSAIVDLFVPVGGDASLGGLTKGTMVLVDRETSDTLLSQFEVTQIVGGGSAANTAVGLTSLGKTASLVARSVPDEFGLEYERQLVDAGVSVLAPTPHADLATGRCVVLVTPDGERTMATYLGASQALVEMLNPSRLAQGRYLYIEGYVLDIDGVFDVLDSQLRRVREAHSEVALSVSDPFLVARQRENLLCLLREMASLVFANEEEALLLTGMKTAADAAEWLSKFEVSGAITLGAKGALGFTTKGELELVGPPPGLVVVDSTGAGDLFASGFLAAAVEGEDLRACVALGVTCASEVIGHFGARPKTPLAALRLGN